MDGLVFYCSNCKRTFAGEDYQASDSPRCPMCNKNTLSTGITKAIWVQKAKEERQEILEALIKEAAQIEENIAKREEYAQAIGVTYEEKTDSNEKLYSDIGTKIKGWAKWIFIIEAIASVIGAIVALFTAEDGVMIFAALLALVLGPILAWVSSWVLYAFGELVDKTVANERNTRNILKLLLENNLNNEKE